MAESEDLKELLEDNIEVSKESLKILKSIQRSNRISSFFRFLYWLVIIGSVVGVYYYFQPFIDSTIKTFQQIINVFSNTQGTTGNSANPSGTQNISPDLLKNLSPDMIKNLQNALKIK